MFTNIQKIYIDRISNDCILSDNKFVKIYNFLVMNNYKIVTDLSFTDIVILDLCGVNNSFLDLTALRIDDYLFKNKKIVLFWCISNIFLNKYLNKIVFISSKDYKDIEKNFSFKFPLSQTELLNYKNKISIIDTNNSFKNYETIDFNKTAFIHICEWCVLNCSYCNIKKIKWNIVSISTSEILKEIKFQIKNWKDCFYLLADDCGSYWIDIKTTFTSLLDEIFALNKGIKVYITNIYPLFFLRFYDKLRKYILSNRITWIILPIQHTSERILKLMNRSYNIENLISILDEIKKQSKTELQNHIIFDHQDETLEEFIWTFRLLKYYDKNYYFKYSDINKIYWKNFISKNLKEKIVLLKKLQKKYNIDIAI